MTMVTVVVPTRNSERTLDACLASIRRQTYTALELVVVDNSSTDATLDIAQRLAHQVLTHGPERSAQRNHGWRAGRGDIAIFIDSDMILEPGVVSEAVALLADARTGSVVIPERGTGIGYLARCRALEKELYLGCRDVEAARAFRRDALVEVGGYATEFASVEDWDLADRVEALGWQVARTQSFIWHDEGRVRLGAAFRKKRYYGRTMTAYLGDRCQRRLGRPGAWNVRLLARTPHYTAGLAVLKGVEAAGIAAGLLDSRRGRGA